MGSAVAEFGVPSAGIGTYRSLGPQILHIFAVSPIHLNQLQARRRATLRVVAFRRQELVFDLALSFSILFHAFLRSLQSISINFGLDELLFDLTLSLTGSHTFHTVSRSLQSVSINFELDVGLHFVSWLSVGRSCYLISPYRLPVFSPIRLNQLRARRRATLRVVGFPSAGVLFDLAPSLTNSHIRRRATLAVVASRLRELFDLTVSLNESPCFPSFFTRSINRKLHGSRVVTLYHPLQSVLSILRSTVHSTLPKMASGINRAPPRLNTQTNHTKLQEDAIPHQQPRTKKRKSRAKFPKQETIGRGPSGPLYSSAAPAPSLSQLPEYDVGGSIPLTLDYDIDDVPPIHIRLESDKLSRHARRKHAQAHRWSSTGVRHVLAPMSALYRWFASSWILSTVLDSSQQLDGNLSQASTKIQLWLSCASLQYDRAIFLANMDAAGKAFYATLSLLALRVSLPWMLKVGLHGSWKMQFMHGASTGRLSVIEYFMRMATSVVSIVVPPYEAELLEVFLMGQVVTSRGVTHGLIPCLRVSGWYLEWSDVLA
ncbi:hypothetical protein BS47DRAFT_1395351 [Hydnum rufescens UP504]|uniref:Uncharacterized protein n=1 Tax=Hydnum rufescens UP504 TaxID=1448309 RepID=A0A9P6AUR7_9AGAM|nr:hypothetical protein BS47DRAFT_1395351 [Hydnum rufescens UP504]